MATTVKSNKWKERVPLPTGVGQSSRFCVVTNLGTGNDGSINSVTKIFPLGVKGLQITDGYIQYGVIDAGGGAVIAVQITDGTTTKTLISGAVSGTGGLARPSKLPVTEDAIGFVTPNENFYLQVKLTTGVTGAVSTTAVIVVGLDCTGYYPMGSVTE